MRNFKQNTMALIKRITVFLVVLVMIIGSIGLVPEILWANSETEQTVTSSVSDFISESSESVDNQISVVEATNQVKEHTTSETIVPPASKGTQQADQVRNNIANTQASSTTDAVTSKISELGTDSNDQNDGISDLETLNISNTLEEKNATDIFQPYWVDDTNLSIQRYKGLTLQPVYVKGSVNPVVVDAAEYIQEKLDAGIEVDEENAFNLDVPLTLDNVNIFSREDYPDDDHRQVYLLTLDRELLSANFEGIVFPKGTLFGRLSAGLNFENHRLLMDSDAEYVKAIVLVPVDWKGKVQILGETATSEMLEGEKKTNASSSLNIDINEADKDVSKTVDASNQTTSTLRPGSLLMPTLTPEPTLPATLTPGSTTEETMVPAPESQNEENLNDSSDSVVSVSPSLTDSVDGTADESDFVSEPLASAADEDTELTPNQVRLLEENMVLKRVYVTFLDGVDRAATKVIPFQDGMLLATELFMQDVSGQSRMTDAEYDEIMSIARYDIQTKPGLYESSENDATELWGSGGTHIKISGQIDSTGRYVIWDVIGSYSQEFSTNRYMYFPFLPNSWLAKGQEIEKGMITVEPFDLMTLVYNTPHSPYVSGYWNDYKDTFWGNSSETFTNVILFWRAWQDSDGVTPIPNNFPIHMKIRTKIKELDRAVYTLGVQAVMSKYVFRNNNDKYYTDVAWGQVAGLKAHLRVHLPFFETQHDNLILRIYQNYQGKKTLYRILNLNRSYANSRNNEWDEYVPRWDENGHKIEYSIEADRPEAKISPLSQGTHEWKISYQDTSSPSVPVATSIGGPYSEAKVSGNTYNREDKMAVSGNAIYSADGQHIIWTITYQHFYGSDSSGGMYFYTPTDFDPNAVDFYGNHTYPKSESTNTLLIPSYDFVQGFPKAKVFSWHKWKSYFNLSPFKYETYSVRTDEGRGIDVKYRDHGLVWTNSILKNAEKISFSFITKINDAAKYNDTYSIVYKGYLDRGGLKGTYTSPYKMTIEGRTIRPFAYFSVVDSIDSSERLEFAKAMQISVRDTSGQRVGRLRFDESQNKFICETSLPRFDSNGRKINYTLQLDNKDSSLFEPYDHYFSQKAPFSANWEIGLQKKKVYRENNNKWGVIALQPSYFEYNPDASSLDKRIPAGFGGMYGYLEGQWKVPDSMQRGDSFYLKLPNVYNVKAPSDFEIKSEQNEVIFRVHVSPENNLLQFIATDYVDSHQNVAGTFRLGPLIASTFDNPNNVTNEPISFETYYKPLGINGAIDSTYSINWNPNVYQGGTYDYVRKEELDEGPDYITYGIMLNRVKEDVSSINFEDFFGGKSNRYRKFKFYRYQYEPKILSEYVRVYSVPELGIGGASRADLDEDHLIWPRRGTSPDITDAIVSSSSMKKNGEGFNMVIQKRQRPIGCIVVTVKTNKLTYEEGQPQVNEAWRGNSFAGSTRYPTFGSGYGNGVFRSSQKGRIRIKKHDVEFSPEDSRGRLQGARLALYHVDTFDPDNVNKGKLAEGVTDEKGELLFDGTFEPGLYDVYELEAPSGFVPLNTPFRLNLDGYDVIHNYYFENARNQGIYLKKISKIQKDHTIPVHTGEGNDAFGKYGGIPLEGAVFQLYKVDPVTNKSIKVGDPKTSSVNGVINWDNIKEVGTYFAEEIRAPEGYVIPSLDPSTTSSVSGYWNNRRVYFKVVKDESLNIYYAPLQYAQNESEESEIWLYKVRKDSEEFSIPIFLEGATFALYKPDSIEINRGVPQLKSGAQPIDVQTSNKVGWIGFKHLHANTQYYVKELRPPEGYQIIEDLIAISTRESNERIERLVINRPVYEEKTIILKKVDANDRTVLLENAYFDLIDRNGEVIDADWTNINGEIHFEHLKPGRYVIRETRAPKNYKLGLIKMSVQGSDSDYSIDSNGNMLVDLRSDVASIAFTVANEKEKVNYDFSIRKQDEDGGKRLQGVSFELLDETKKKVIQTKVTNQQGEILFEKLPEGIYYLREKQALEGYHKMMLIPEGQPYRLEKDGTLQIKLMKGEDNQPPRSLYIINNSKKYVPNFFLPEVGGHGIYGIFSLGLLAFFLGFVLIALKLKKNEEKNKV